MTEINWEKARAISQLKSILLFRTYQWFLTAGSNVQWADNLINIQMIKNMYLECIQWVRVMETSRLNQSFNQSQLCHLLIPLSWACYRSQFLLLPISKAVVRHDCMNGNKVPWLTTEAQELEVWILAPSFNHLIIHPKAMSLSSYFLTCSIAKYCLPKGQPCELKEKKYINP